MSKYHPDARSQFCKVRLQPSNEIVELRVQTLKKSVKGTFYKGQEYVEYNGNQYLLPEHWAHLGHVYEIPEAEAIANGGEA